MDQYRIFDNPLAKCILFPKSFLKALTIFLAIYLSLSKRSRLVQENFMASFHR